MVSWLATEVVVVGVLKADGGVDWVGDVNDVSCLLRGGICLGLVLPVAASRRRRSLCEYWLSSVGGLRKGGRPGIAEWSPPPATRPWRRLN